MSLVLIGHGRMGRLVEQYAVAHGFTVAGIVTDATGPSLLESREMKGVEAVIDFSAGPAVRANLERIATRGWNVVIGTTGWNGEEEACRTIVEKAGIGVIASANFSIGMNVFRRIAEDAAKRFATMPDVGAWIHEAHHIKKKD